jgi:VanZ family protein
MRGSTGRAVVAVALIVVGLVLLHLADPVSDTLLARELQNAGHALLFGIIALLALTVCTTLGLTGTRALVGALAATLVLGAVSELLQILSPNRDASLGDWLRDGAGAVAFLSLATAWRRDRRRPPRAYPFVIAAVLCLGLVAAPLASLWLDYRARDASFPLLCCHTGGWEERFVRSNHLELISAEPGSVPVSAPDLGARSSGFMRASFAPARWPGLSVHEVYPDWSGYDVLALDIYAETPPPVDLVLRVDDLDHDGVTFDDRFNRNLKIKAGMNRIRVPIAEILGAPAGRRMDVTRMKRVFLFAETPQVPFTVYWDGLRLQ